MAKRPVKSEAELIATVANVRDADACFLYAERARSAGMLALAAACEERLKELRPLRQSKIGNAEVSRTRAAAPKKTLIVAEQALTMLIDDYTAGLGPTTYGELAKRCGFEGQKNVRWFGQVTDLIDAACALADVPSFALVRVREANGEINHAAWRNEYAPLRDQIIAKANAGLWAGEEFTKMRDALAVFSNLGFGNKRAWQFVVAQIDVQEWAGAR